MDRYLKRRGPHKRYARYWKEYDAKYRVFDKKIMFDWLVEKAETLGQPFSKRGTRGRDFALTPCEYVALFVIAVFFDMTEREVELESKLLTGKHIDHSTFGKIIDRIPERYLSRLLASIRSELDNYLRDDWSVYLADSTLVSLDRQYEPRTYAMDEREVTKTDPMTVLVEYFPERGVLAVNDAMTGQHSDVRALADFIDTPLIPLKEDSPLYADRGFDGKRSLEASYRAKLSCGIKLKDWGKYRGIRRKAHIDFDAKGYKKFRGLVEAVFGGLSTKGLDHTRFRRQDRVRKWNLTSALTQNVQTYMRLFCIPLA